MTLHNHLWHHPWCHDDFMWDILEASPHYLAWWPGHMNNDIIMMSPCCPIIWRVPEVSQFLSSGRLFTWIDVIIMMSWGHLRFYKINYPLGYCNISHHIGKCNYICYHQFLYKNNQTLVFSINHLFSVIYACLPIYLVLPYMFHMLSEVC